MGISPPRNREHPWDHPTPQGLSLTSLLSSPSIPVSPPRASPEDLQALLGDVQRLNETFRDLRLQLLPPPPHPDLLEHLWSLQDLLHNHSDSLLLLTASLRRLEELLRILQSRAGQTDVSVSRLRDSLSREGEAAQLELWRLSAEANGSRTLLEHHQLLLGRLGGRMEALGEQVEALAGAVDSMNRSLSEDIRLQRSRLRDLRGILGNASQDARRIRAEQAATERQLRMELALLGNVTEELRLKDWEHSAALRNVSVIRGEEEMGMRGGMGDVVGLNQLGIGGWLGLGKLSKVVESKWEPTLVLIHRGFNPSRDGDPKPSWV